MATREIVPRWLILLVLVAIGANLLATTMTGVTIGLMGSMTPFAVALRNRDVALLPYFLAIVYPAATLGALLYL